MKDWITDKKFWKQAFIRAIRTVAQGALAGIGTTVTMLHEVNWLMVLSTASMAGIVSILTSISIGMPEYSEGGEANEDK